MKIQPFSIISSILLFSFANAQPGITLKPNYRDSSKKIAYYASIGGSSHINWVLNILDELGSREHNTTFLTTDDEARFGQPYTHISTISIGTSPVKPEGGGIGAGNIASLYPADFFALVLDYITENFERDFLSLKKYFVENNVDLVICDHIADPCYEAARILNLPFIVTATSDVSGDSGAPYINNKFTIMDDQTTEHLSFLVRFKNQFINPLRDIYTMMPFIKQFNARKVKVGIPSSFEDHTAKWKDSLKLVNCINGYAAPRPTGPLVEYVGPIIPKHYNSLTEELQTYLDSHERVAYVAFGQQSTPSEDETKLILTALLENIENDSLDGIIWASVNAAELFPDTITTSSGKIYKSKKLFDNADPNVRIVKWAPQVAVLLHPSTTLFVSHGGLTSWYESMYSGTRMILFPFFGDQPGNSLAAERSKLGGILRLDYTVEEATTLIKKIVEDKDGEIMKSVKRFQAMTQIHSVHSVIRAADLVEEVAYTHVDGKLPHRESADRRMSYIKSHNLDLFGAFAALFYIFCRFSVALFKYLFTFVTRSVNQKIKQS